MAGSRQRAGVEPFEALHFATMPVRWKCRLANVEYDESLSEGDNLYRAQLGLIAQGTTASRPFGDGQ